MPNILTLNNTNAPLLLSDVERIEQLHLEQEQVHCPVTHIFGPGVYIREIFMPAGTAAMSHYHNQATLNIMIKGKVIAVLDNGEHKELVAPMTFTSPPGRKIGYIAEDTIWQNVFATTETDVEKLEAMFFTKTNFYEDRNKTLLIERSEQMQELRASYAKIISDLNTTEEEVRAIVEDMSDHAELPYGSYKFQMADSPIQGKGIFATADIKQDELIGVANLNGKRTILGRRTNHAIPPNAMMIRVGNDINLYALRDIKGNDGGALGEEITIDYGFTQLSLNTNTRNLLCLVQIK